MALLKISLPTDDIVAFCQRWQVVEFSLFGSVLREDFNPKSDLDVLVSFSPTAQVSLFDLVQMKLELEELLQRPVDVVEKEALRNPYRRQEILANAQVIYAA